MRVWTLGSGSSGNALVVESDGARLLVDCGFGPRALATRLKAIGVAPESISGLLVTHEHVDHAQGAERAQKKWRWPVLASMGTLGALRDIETRWRRPVGTREPISFEGFSVEAVSVPHDAAGPLAFVITATRSGARLGVAHDLGAIPPALRARFAHCDILCLEANHDAVMLQGGPYPAALKARIRGGKGHLNNEQGAALAADLSHPGLRAVVLLHLSAVNNTPEVAEGAVRAPLRRAGFRGALCAAPRREPTLVATAGAAGPIATARSQLDLGL